MASRTICPRVPGRRRFANRELTIDLHTVDDLDDRRVPDQCQEAREQDDERQAHPLRGGLGASLGLGELPGAHRGGLGGQARANLGALGTGQGDARGQLGQLGDAELGAELARISVVACLGA